MSQSTQASQIQTDQNALQTDLQTIASSSGVTAADLANLGSDSQVIAGSGVKLDGPSLTKVTSELATAVTGGADASQAKSDFNALFANSSISQTTVDKAFNDMTVAIQHSNVTSANLQTVAAAQQVVQADIGNLRNGVTGSSSIVATSSTSASSSSSAAGATAGTGSTAGATTATSGAATSATATSTSTASSSATSIRASAHHFRRVAHRRFRH
jgi:hypothetical protein